MTAAVKPRPERFGTGSSDLSPHALACAQMLLLKRLRPCGVASSVALCQFGGMIDDRVGKLSERQRDCLRLVAQLKKTEQIAVELGISPYTVNTYIERAFDVLGVSSRREAARLVVLYDAACPEKLPTEISRLSLSATDVSSPVPTTTATGRRRNDLNWPQRLALAVLALVLLCFALGGLGAAIEQLSDWRASLALQ